jgi:ABC-type dipeptide/oligopeptide/nickel transport system permease component
MKRLVEIIKKIFSTVLAACLLIGFAMVIIFTVALILGGEAAVSLSSIVDSVLLPLVCISSVVISFLGILKMYLCGEKSYVLETKKTKQSEDKSNEKT